MKIGLIAASVALPSFVRAMQGQRIRSSARLVVTSHKFARNMSVLKQTPMAVLFNRVENKIDVVSIAGMEQMANRDRFLEQQAQAAANAPMDDDAGAAGDEEAEAAAPPFAVEDTQALGRDVKIVDFESDADIPDRDGVYWVNYYPSGMSDGFELRLADVRGKDVVIKADAISGGIKVEYEK